MDRFQPLSITNSSLGAHLYPSEEVYLLTTNVGLYSGPYKSLPHSSGTIYLTSHRLFYVDDHKPHLYSCFLLLDLIKETQYYAGFLKSSAKVTLGFKKGGEGESKTVVAGEGPQSSNLNAGGDGTDWRQKAVVQDNDALLVDAMPTKLWTCRICAFRNTMDTSIATTEDRSVKCQLCGVNSLIKDVVVEEQKSQSKSNGSKPATTTLTSKDGFACPTCTFANHPSMARCEICDTLLGTIKPSQLRQETIKKQSDSMNSSRAQTPVAKEDDGERHDSVRLSFRKGGDKAFYSILKTTLQDKSWLKVSLVDGDSNRQSRDRFSSVHRNIDGRTASSALESGAGNNMGSNKRVGIEAVFSAIDLQAREESDDMRDAFRDLEALMARAKKMVDLAETLNAKLTRQEAAAKGAGLEGQNNDEAANLIRSSLVRLGLPTPAITLDMAKDEMEYNLQLAYELAGLLYAGASPLMGRGRVMKKPNMQSQHASNINETTLTESGREIMPLDELWCMWNRARGVALVSPKTLLAVCDILPSITLPQIDCKTFQSGLRVLQTSKYQSSRFSLRVLRYLEEINRHDDDEVRGEVKINIGASTLEIAEREKCPLHLVTELLQQVEYELGTLVRDDSGQTSWHENQIVQFNWDHWQEQRMTSSIGPFFSQNNNM